MSVLQQREISLLLLLLFVILMSLIPEAWREKKININQNQKKMFQLNTNRKSDTSTPPFNLLTLKKTVTQNHQKHRVHHSFVLCMRFNILYCILRSS